MTKEIRRKNVDMLHGSIMKSLLIFSLPIMGSNIFQQMYNMVDTMIVGNVLGETSLAAIGAGSPIYELLVGFAVGIGGGLSIVTARSYGCGDRKLLKKSVACAIVIAVTVAVALTVVAQLGTRPLLVLLNTPNEILGEVQKYISTITLFLIVMVIYNLCSGILRAIGNSVMPLVFLIVSSVLNVGLDLLFIIKFKMGVQGAAIATVLAQGVSVVLCIIYIWKRSQILIPGKEDFKVEKKLAADMISQGLSMGFMNCIVSTGTVILQSGINNLGYLTIAGHTAARKSISFCSIPINSMSQAISTFVSQNRGADQPKRIRRAIRDGIIYDIFVAAFVTIVAGAMAPKLIALISGSHESVILQNGSMYVRFASPFLAAVGIVVSVRCSLQGLGQKVLPLVSSVIEFLGKIVFASLLIPRFQYYAVIFCEPTVWCLMAVQLLYSFYTDPYIRSAKSR
jgi:putative MATE family efflux protein